MNAADKKALDELQAYLESRDEKTNRQSDKRIISAKAKELNPEYQKTRREKINSPEANAKRSISSRQSHSDPEVKARHAAGQAKVRASKEYQETMAKVYADPIRRQKCREGGRTQIRAVTTPAGQFESRTGAAKHYGISAQAMGNRIKDINHYLEFYYTDTGPVKPKAKPKALTLSQKYVRKVKTPMGVFTNLRDASQAHGVHADTIKYRMKSEPTKYKWLDDRPGPRKVKTPDGIFDNIKETADFYKVTAKTIRQWITLDKKDDFKLL